LQKIAIITSHPIQYNAPWFKLLAERKRIALKVFYTWGQLQKENKYDPGFGKNVSWDIPLLQGYNYTFVENTASQPGSHHYKGIDNPTLIREIEAWDPDAVLVFGWKFKSHLKVLRHFKGKRTVVFRGDSNMLDELKGFSIKKMARRIFLKWIYIHVDKAFYVGSANKEYYLRHGIKLRQLIFAPHAVDNDRFCQRAGNDVRQELNIPAGDLIFLYAGKLEAKKNLHFLMTACATAGMQKAHLVIVGNGVLETDLKGQRLNLKKEMQKHIHFMDFQNQAKMPGIYESCDVFVLPSGGPGETWGLAVNEAMASGKPVLVSDKCGCAADLVRDGINGFIFKSNDTEDLVSKMRQLNLPKDTLALMGEASRDIVKDWSFENICVAIEGTMNNGQ
jgi:glycosyltransferase involved in cell wall biosynthesis